MLFNSQEFVFFFILVAIAYYAVCHFTKRLAVRNVLLLVASYYFYMSWRPKMGLLLLGSSLMAYAGAIYIEKAKKVSHKKWILGAVIAADLLALIYYKYLNFFCDAINSLLRFSDIALTLPNLDILLPIGISFFLLQQIGYLIDVYRGDTKAERNVVSLLLFISFFPQLLAGPIERSRNLLAQVNRHIKFDNELAYHGLMTVIWGYFLKIVLADNAGFYADLVFTDVHNIKDGISILWAFFLFAFQIYGDFAGYTFIAIGCAEILGFRLVKNFDAPYFSASFTEFWHRWHMSLSLWIRDYLYIPLGGNRKGKLHTYINLLASFAISGLWHGANFTYLTWGVMNGAAVCAEKAVGLPKMRLSVAAKTVMRVLMFVTMIFVVWPMFRANSIEDYCFLMSHAFDPTYLVMARETMSLKYALVAIAILLCRDYFTFSQKPIPFIQSQFAKNAAMVILLLIISTMGFIDSSHFIYFQF